MEWLKTFIWIFRGSWIGVLVFLLGAGAAICLLPLDSDGTRLVSLAGSGQAGE